MHKKDSPESLNYNSLLDEHLAGFYSSPQRRRHLRRMGLITRDGSLVDERTFQRRAMVREYRKRYRVEMKTNAAAVVSEEERMQKVELKKLEALAKYETVQRIKREKLHPPNIQTYHPPMGRSIHVPGQTAPVPKSKPASNSFSRSRLSSAVERHKERVAFTEKELEEIKQLMETITGARAVTPTILQTKAPPNPLSSIKPRIKTKKKSQAPSRPSTAPMRMKGVARKSTGHETVPPVKVTLRYLGTTKAVKEKMPLTVVEVRQQARGYTPIPVYKGNIRAGEVLSFDSIRYPKMPYSLVIYTDGMIDCRVSVCCEYRHRPRTRLGGKSAHFKVESIQGGSPCNQCMKAREDRRKKQRRRLEERHFRPPLSSTLQSTQLDTSYQTHSTLSQQETSSLTHISKNESEEDGENSPLSSSFYSTSFHSDSPHESEEENGEEIHPTKMSKDEASIQEDTNDRSRLSSAGKTAEIDPVTEDLKEGKNQDQVHPEMVSKRGVRIVYQIFTTERGTQTDEYFSTEASIATAEHRPSNRASATDAHLKKSTASEIREEGDERAGLQNLQPAENRKDATQLVTEEIPPNQLEKENKDNQILVKAVTIIKENNKSTRSEIDSPNLSELAQEQQTSNLVPSTHSINQTEEKTTNRENELLPAPNSAQEAVPLPNPLNIAGEGDHKLDSESLSSLTQISERNTPTSLTPVSTSLSPSPSEASNIAIKND